MQNLIWILLLIGQVIIIINNVHAPIQIQYRACQRQDKEEETASNLDNESVFVCVDSRTGTNVESKKS